MKEESIIYHGSNVVVNIPQIIISRYSFFKDANNYLK